MFPPPEQANAEGLIAWGGDLSTERLIEAYRAGIFPWYNSDQPILWWSPDPRMVLFPEELHCPKRLRRTIDSNRFRITLDEQFAEVIAACACAYRPGQNGTWITADMAAAYISLHHAGFAHSVEAWLDGELAGGLYGVSLGGCFFGESMFADSSDASKTAFVRLVEQLRAWGFTLIDCQMHTEHLARFGAREIPRNEFLERLGAGLEHPTRQGSWRFDVAEG